MTLPELILPWNGGRVSLPPLQLADGSGPAVQQTTISVSAGEGGLAVAFRCDDRDIWGTLQHRDDPIYNEECVEVFLAAGDADPVDYFEFEVSPFGVLLDALIHNPTGDIADRTADFAWNAAGVRWAAHLDESHTWWTAELLLPWAALGFASDNVPRLWRGNFYRIERPRDGSPPEFSCWSPTLTQPANFHRPERFGLIRLV